MPTDDLSSWIDHHGTRMATPTIAGRLRFRIPLHRALRAFVFYRDAFKCRKCGIEPVETPANYDGSRAVSVPGRSCLVMDHVVSRRNGGAHHPSNLMTLCDRCNAAKSGAVDSKGVGR